MTSADISQSIESNRATRLLRSLSYWLKQKKTTIKIGIHWQPCHLARLIRFEWLMISLMFTWSGFLLISALK